MLADVKGSRHNVERPAFHLLVNLADVFSEYANADQQGASHQARDDRQRSPARNRIPTEKVCQQRASRLLQTKTAEQKSQNKTEFEWQAGKRSCRGPCQNDHLADGILGDTGSPHAPLVAPPNF